MNVQPTPFVKAIRCDKCGIESHFEDDIEFTEYVSIDHHCGYATGDEDGKHVQVDLCFACFKELLGPYWRVMSDRIGGVDAADDSKARHR